MPSFRGNKYEASVTIFVSRVSFEWPSVHPDTQMISNQESDW